MNSPPITISHKIVDLCIKISDLLGYAKGINLPEPKPKLRKENQIKTIQATLAIEGNSFSVDQVTAIIDGQRVRGKESEIIEVKNTIAVYEKLHQWIPSRKSSMRKAHRFLMRHLIDNPGEWRSSGVGIIKGYQISHMAPPADRVPFLMDDLFDYLTKDRETHVLIKACVFHYELLFIHPFIDGNGRMARLWQQLILFNHNPVFRFVSIESLIKENQTEYYRTLEKSDKSGESTVFVEFLLGLILSELDSLVQKLDGKRLTFEERIKQAAEHFGEQLFSRKEYLNYFEELSSATASRELKKAVDRGLLLKQGDKATARYRFK
ncbi:Fic family protein [bacterium]|nr:Fic family protein [bacterium]